MEEKSIIFLIVIYIFKFTDFLHEKLEWLNSNYLKKMKQLEILLIIVILVFLRFGRTKYFLFFGLGIVILEFIMSINSVRRAFIPTYILALIMPCLFIWLLNVELENFDYMFIPLWIISWCFLYLIVDLKVAKLINVIFTGIATIAPMIVKYLILNGIKIIPSDIAIESEVFSLASGLMLSIGIICGIIIEIKEHCKEKYCQ
ncbi:hypothetical protein [uncultured Fusobacterium sp.]|uniref:hypothetical protein n=1 Tax=uncultured Fusobacterium sp. TaxID=159267 RepID=UPI0025FC3DDB|nr:hypothetical protein [uncultured Fusobacterium sp.]